MANRFARLFGSLVRLDESGTDPPWPLQIWNQTTAVWEPLGGTLTGCRLSAGSGAPTLPGGQNPDAGDYYLRTDTPTVANQRIYVCTVGGATPTWLGIL